LTKEYGIVHSPFRAIQEEEMIGIGLVLVFIAAVFVGMTWLMD
jgi:hypothetical protein